MNPLFFPFTHLTQKDRAAMLACFKAFSHLSVTRPNELSKNNRKDNRVEVLRPSDKDLASALAMVEDYRQWASVNRGRAGQLKTRVPNAPYFTSDTGISTLKSTIEMGAESFAGSDSGSFGSESKRSMEKFLKALVFLRISQDSDFETEQIARGFTSIKQREAALFSALKGNDLPLDYISADDSEDDLLDNNQETSADHWVEMGDRGEKMTEQKVLAWSCFFRKKMEFFNPDANFLPVTTSPAVIDYFKSTAKKSIKVLDIANFKVHEGSCSQLIKTIENAVLAQDSDEKKMIEADDGCALLADIQLYLFSGRKVTDIFNPVDQKGIKNRMIQGEKGKIPICLVHVKK